MCFSSFNKDVMSYFLLYCFFFNEGVISVHRSKLFQISVNYLPSRF